MGVTVIDVSSMEWQEVPTAWEGKAAPGRPGVRFKSFTSPAPEVPNGQLIEYEAGHAEGEHSHEEGELYYLLTGDLTILNLPVDPGTIVYIPAGTRYANRTVGGCSFLRLGLGSNQAMPRER
jgi:hypothetical protein